MLEQQNSKRHPGSVWDSLCVSLLLGVCVCVCATTLGWLLPCFLFSAQFLVIVVGRRNLLFYLEGQWKHRLFNLTWYLLSTEWFSLPAVLVLEPRALCVLGKCSTTELYFQLSFGISWCTTWILKCQYAPVVDLVYCLYYVNWVPKFHGNWHVCV